MTRSTVSNSLRKNTRLAAIWLAAGGLSLILFALLYTLFIGRDRVAYNEAIYENYLLIKEPHSEQLFSWEGYGLTTYGENGLVVDKDVNPDILRIVILGDSHVEAKQVSDQHKFSEILERSWNEANPDQPLQTLNLGIGGRDIPTYLSFGRNIDRTFEPDLVFLLLKQNDFKPLIQNPGLLAQYQEDPNLIMVKPERLSRVNKLLSDSPMRQFFLRIKGQEAGFLQRQGVDDDLTPAAKSDIPVDDLLGHEESVATQLKLLKDIWGARLVIIYSVFIPSYGQEAPASNERDTLLNEAEKQGIPVVNLYEPLLAATLAKKPPRGFQNTTPGVGHYNRLGHKIIANELLTYLEETGVEALRR